jgi:hypothetical protein
MTPSIGSTATNTRDVALVVLTGAMAETSRRARLRRKKTPPRNTVGAGQHHAFVLVEHAARAFAGEVAGGEPRLRRGGLDQPFGGTADAQLDALVLELLRGGVLALKTWCTVKQRALQDGHSLGAPTCQ